MVRLTRSLPVRAALPSRSTLLIAPAPRRCMRGHVHVPENFARVTSFNLHDSPIKQVLLPLGFYKELDIQCGQQHTQDYTVIMWQSQH